MIIQFSTIILLLGYARNNPGVLNKFSLKVFGEGRTEYMNLILNKNSPLYPAWKQASLRLMESGIGSKFDKLWLGELKSSSSIEDTLTVLKPTHLVLVFFIVSCSILLCSAVLIIEQLWYKGKQFGKPEDLMKPRRHFGILF